jgi:hypothetical protein
MFWPRGPVLAGEGDGVPRHRLLTDEELRRLLGVPADRDALARHFTLTPSDHDLVLTRQGEANRLGFAVQLALLRHPDRALTQAEEPLDALVVWITPRSMCRRTCSPIMPAGIKR